LDGKLVVQIMEPRERDPSIQRYQSTVGIQMSFFDVGEMNAQMRFNIQPNELRGSGINPQYHRNLGVPNSSNLWEHYLIVGNQSILNNNNLSITTIHGDTICRFIDFNLSEIERLRRTTNTVHVPSNIYRIHGQTMLQVRHNDTVFRVTPPNRLSPAYVINWGQYKPDVIEHTLGSALEGKLILRDWVETPRFIFIHYTEGRDSRLREQGKYKEYWAIFDKTANTLTNHVTSERQPTQRVLHFVRPDGRSWMWRTGLYDSLAIIENDIDNVGMPFWPQGINHRGEMYMVFSKETIKRYIERGMNQNDKLQAIYENLPDDSFGIMIVR
jgi:hypothetical protein